jgi:hypothetical protein
MIPFFGYLTFGNRHANGGDTGITLSMVSTVVANVTGLMTGGLYLFLRSSTISSIAPKNKLDEYERQQMKHQIRMPKANDADLNGHMLRPVAAPQWLPEVGGQEKRSVYGYTSSKELQGSIVFNSADDTNPLGSNAILKHASFFRNSDHIQAPSLRAPIRKMTSSYRLFPNKTQGNRASSKVLLPSMTYSPNENEHSFKDCCDSLQPPPPIQPLGFRHRRDSSMASSATVQIGLRLSNVEDVRPITGSTIGGLEGTHELGCPNKPKVTLSARPSPLIISSSAESIASSQDSQHSLGVTQVDTIMKTLPSVPQDSHAEVETAFMLNPTVYIPESPTKGKVPSPKGVGFNVPARSRSNTTPIEAAETATSASRPRGNSIRAANRADWI